MSDMTRQSVAIRLAVENAARLGYERLSNIVARERLGEAVGVVPGALGDDAAARIADKALSLAKVDLDVQPSPTEQVAPAQREALEAARNWIRATNSHSQPAQSLLRQIDAALSAPTERVVPEGWKLVPVEPAHEMTWAATATADRELFYRVGHEDAKKLWAAMLAAAPSPAEPAQPKTIAELGMDVGGKPATVKLVDEPCEPPRWANSATSAQEPAVTRRHLSGGMVMDAASEYMDERGGVIRMSATPAQEPAGVDAAPSTEESSDVPTPDKAWNDVRAMARVLAQGRSIGPLLAAVDTFGVACVAARATPTAPPSDPWKLAVDEALIGAGLDCIGDEDDAAETLRRLIDWRIRIALDPAVSDAVPTAPVAPIVEIDFKQATELLALFGGEPTVYRLDVEGEGTLAHGGPGLYATVAEYPEDGSWFLGRTAHHARPDAPPPAETPTAPVAPIDMVLHCPACGMQHIDSPESNDRRLVAMDPPAGWAMPPWKNEPHRSHLCHGCGHIWRPADVPTNGVAAVKTKGKADSPVAAPPPAEAREPLSEHHKLDNDRQVFFYEQDFYVLSNFSAFNLQWRGRTFPTSEHAYHYEKFVDNDDAWNSRGSIAEQVLHAPSAHEAFKLAEGAKHRRRKDWDDVKAGIMLDILHAKAAQHEYVRRKLLATGDRELIEDSWRDDYWGWGPNRDGQNILGKLWMQVRDELRSAIPLAGNTEGQG